MINFPGLGLEFNIDRVAFSIGSFEVYWYGIIIALGLLLGVTYAYFEGKRLSLPKDTILDVALIATPTAVVFARLYFVVFNWHTFRYNPLSAFDIRQGGIAIYGAVIGGVLAAWIYCRVKKVSLPVVADAAAGALLIGQIIGRWGNFVNQEAYGSITSLPWRMEIYSFELGQMIAVHPTFLYESLWNLIGLIGILLYRKRKKFNGEVFLLYVAWYGLGRSWIEQLRVDSLPYEASFKISQIVAIVTCLAAIGTIIYMRIGKSKTSTEQN